MAAEKKGQLHWSEIGLSDLRNATPEDQLELPDVVQGANPSDSNDVALRLLEAALGFADGVDEIELASPLGTVTVRREHLPHMVEKRMHGRERYGLVVVATLANPFEIWQVEYDDDSYRMAYIGLFKGKTQMLVVVNYLPDRVLWNFMQSDHKSLNKHRHGALLYQRSKKTKGEPIDGSPAPAFV
jgi:hypothetical protein